MAVAVSAPTHKPRPGGDGPSVGPRASGARPGSDPALLEHYQNVVTHTGEQVFEVTKCGCDCWFCTDCCQRKGYNLRAELVPILETFTGLMMLTLTIDPALFDSPRAAYLYVRQQRGISRLMRELDRLGHLHTRRYFYVVEFQKQTEQAHFHVLVDATRIPKPAIDAAWSRLRPKKARPAPLNRPAFGMTRFSVPRFEGGAVHAARYATKYLVKSPAHGWPEWVLSMGDGTRVPRYQSSRGFWNREPKPASRADRTRHITPRTYAERISECGETCNLFAVRERIDRVTGLAELCRTWLARLNVAESSFFHSDHDPTRRLRLRFPASSVAACIERLQRITGEPIPVICGLGMAGGAA